MLPALEHHTGRRGALAVLGLLVLGAHLGLMQHLAPARLGEGAADTLPRRIEVAFVRPLQPAEPPVVPPRPPAVTRRLATLPPVPTAADAPASAPALDPPPAPLPEPAPTLAELAPLPPLPAAVAASAPNAAFDWPPSTQLRYTLTGDVRGPVHGTAVVEWLRQGNRYQVRMDVAVGPSFAPLFTRRILSEGEITAGGLAPRRYDEETRMALREPRRLTIWLDADQVRLPGGATLPRPGGVQDSASQFVQMTWLFTTQPEWLRAGQVLEMPLALPRRVMPWLYDVGASEILATPFGPVPVVPVRPRIQTPRAGELAVELWVAPTLQYLPARMLIRQDADVWIELMIEQLPLQAAPAASAPGSR